MGTAVNVYYACNRGSRFSQIKNSVGVHLEILGTIYNKYSLVFWTISLELPLVHKLPSTLRIFSFLEFGHEGYNFFYNQCKIMNFYTHRDMS